MNWWSSELMNTYPCGLSSGFSQGWLSNWSVKKIFPVEDRLSKQRIIRNQKMHFYFTWCWWGEGTFYTMLGTFPKDYFQVANSQGYFPKWQFPKSAIFQAVTSQICKFPSTQLCPSRSARPLALEGLNLTSWKISLGKL